jgi:hypothetical protein
MSEHTISTPPDSPHHHSISKNKHQMTPGTENTHSKPTTIPFPLDTPAHGSGENSMPQSVGGHYHDDDEDASEDDIAEQLDEINENLKELKKQQKDLCDYVMETSHHVHIQKVENWLSYIDDSKYVFKWIRYVFAYVKWFYGCLGLVPLLGPYLQILFIANIFCTAYVYTPKLVQEMILMPLLRCLWTALLMIFSPLATCLYSIITSTNMLGMGNTIKAFLIDTIGDAYTMFSKGLLGASESPFFKEFIAVASYDLDAAKDWAYSNLEGGISGMLDQAGNLKAFFNP